MCLKSCLVIVRWVKMGIMAVETESPPYPNMSSPIVQHALSHCVPEHSLHEGPQDAEKEIKAALD